MAKEKNLTTVTSVAAADFARIVTSAGASVKATAANLAKYIIETYNGSTVAGSAQSVKSALDSLNSNRVKILTKQFTVTVSAGGYSLMTSYETLGIDREQIVGYYNSSGSYQVMLQMATEGVYIFSQSAISNKSLTFRFAYI